MYLSLKSFLVKRGWNQSSLSWVFYDWGNSAFATIILVGLFPIFYREQWASELSQDSISLSLGVINSLAGLLLILIAPLLGSIADASHIKKPMLVLFAFAGAVLTLMFAFIPQGQWLVSAICYVFAVLFFMGGNVFYDALLVDVAEPAQYNRVSSVAYAVGYLGGGFLLVISIGLIWNAALFGMEYYEMMRVSFFMTGIWWAVFTLPILFKVYDRKKSSERGIGKGIRQFMQTFSLLRQYPRVGWFLLAYWLYIDGVDTVIRMSVTYGQVIGFSAVDLMVALILVQFIGFPATLVYGILAEKFGNVAMIIVGIVGYIIICLWGALIDTLTGFYLLAGLIALLQGGLQAQSRAFFASIIPINQAAQFFGIYNLLGRFAVVIGPLLMASIGTLSGNLRIGIASVSILLIAGLFVFYHKVLRQPTA